MPSPNAPDFVRLTVLVADATAVGRQLAVFLLEQRGHHVEAFATGKELLVRHAAVPADLHLIEVNLVEPDALETARRLRGAQTTGRLIALSPEPASDCAPCLAAGFDAIVLAPLEPKALDDLLARFAAPVIHVTELLNRVAGNRKLLQQMADALGQSVFMWDSELTAAAAAGNADTIHRIAHQIKGALANLAAGPATAAAKALDDLGKSGNLSAVPAARQRLWSELARVQVELAHLAQ